MAEPALSPDPADDLSGPYMQHAQAQTTSATIEAFRQRMRQRATQMGAGEAAAAQQATPPATAGSELLHTKEGFPFYAPISSAATAAGAVVGDVARGFTEAPTAIAGGLTDAARNSASALNNLGNWLNENVADLRVDIPSTGNETADAILRPFLDPTEGLAKLPKVKKQQTVTGDVIREGARFVAGFVPALRALKAGGASTVPAALGAGAISDFATQDPNAPNISNLIESVPALKNPVTEFLAADPDDSEALNRLRQAVEGVGMGALAEGVVHGVRALARSRRAQPEAVAQQAAQDAAQQAERDFLWLGSPDQPLVVKRQPSTTAKLATAMQQTKTGVPDDIAAKGLTKAAGQDGEVYINFGRISQPDDVKKTIRDMASAFKGEIDEARRGVQSNTETQRLANLIGMTPEDLLVRRKGQPFNAEEALAARRLWNTSAEKLTQAAERASSPNAGAVDLYNFRRMMAVHHAIQSEVIAARTETARALQSWAIPAGSGGMEKARMVEQLLEQTGGSAVSQELARRIAALSAEGAPAGALANAVRVGWGATSMDMVRESFILGLLWSPSTHIVNSASNLTVALQQIYERAAGRMVGDVLGSAVDARIVDGEALAMTYGMISSFKDAFRLAGRAVVTGETGTSISKIDTPRQRAISSEAIARERGLNTIEAQQFTETATGRFVDFVGETVRVPGRLLGAEDEFFKTTAYRMESHAQALRKATQEGLTGPERFRRMAELVNEPSETMRISAVDAALYNTFQNRTGRFGEGLMKLRGDATGGSFNPTFAILPFIKTPTNILRYAFERTPLAPLVRQWRDDIAAGGARRDLALARMATGTAIISVALDFASSGLITGAGPKDAGKREALMRTGWQPNSIYVGGKYYSFNRADPMGMLLGFAGTVAEKMKESDSAPEDFDSWEEIIGAGIATVSASVVDKTYFTGVAQVIRAIEGAETGPNATARWLDRQTGAMMPFTTLANTMKRFADPVTREVNSPWDGIQSRIIGLSDSLPPSRDLWGRERSTDEVYGRTFDIISPAAVRARKESPIDDEMVALDMGQRRIAKRGAFAGADVDFRSWPQVYDEYVRLAGNDLRHPVYGLGAMDYLNEVVTGQHYMSGVYQLYSDGPEGGKAQFIKNTIADYRRLAQESIMSDAQFADFRAHVEGRRETRRQERFQLSPDIMQPPSVPRGMTLQ